MQKVHKNLSTIFEKVLRAKIPVSLKFNIPTVGKIIFPLKLKKKSQFFKRKVVKFSKEKKMNFSIANA